MFLWISTGAQETSPKTLNTSYNITADRMNEDQSEDIDLNLVSEHFPTSSCAVQISRAGFEDFCVNSNCKRQHQSAPDDESFIVMESTTSGITVHFSLKHFILAYCIYTPMEWNVHWF